MLRAHGSSLSLIIAHSSHHTIIHSSSTPQSPNKVYHNDNFLNANNNSNSNTAPHHAPPTTTTTTDVDAWNRVVAKIEQEDSANNGVGEHNQNLQAFLQNLQALEESQNQLQHVFEQGFEQLSKLVDSFVNVVAGDVYSKCNEQLAAKEEVILKLFQSNHERRQALVDKLHKVQRNCELYKAQVLQQQHDDNGDVLAGTDSHNANNNTSSTPSKDTSNDDTSPPPDDTTEGPPEPNWVEIANSYEPSRRNIEAFLQGRAKMQQADLVLTNTMQELEQALKDALERFQMVSSKAYNDITDPLVLQQTDIQQYFASNVERRERYEAVIEQRAQMAQNVFARLLSRALGPMRGMLSSSSSSKKNNKRASTAGSSASATMEQQQQQKKPMSENKRQRK